MQGLYNIQKTSLAAYLLILGSSILPAPLLRCCLSLGGGVIAVPVGVEGVSECLSTLLVLSRVLSLRIFLLTTTCCSKKRLQWRLDAALIYRYKYESLEGSLKPCLFSTTIIVSIPHPSSCDRPSQGLLLIFTKQGINSLLWLKPQIQSESG